MVNKSIIFPIMAIILVWTAAPSSGDNTVILNSQADHSLTGIKDQYNSQYNEIISATGPGNVAAYSSSDFTTNAIMDSAQLDQMTNLGITGARNIVISKYTTLFSNTPDIIRGTQTRTSTSIIIPSGFDVQLMVGHQILWPGITSNSGIGELNFDAIFSKDNIKYKFGTIGKLPSITPFNMDLFGNLPKNFGMDIGNGYTDFVSKDGLDYSGGMDVENEKFVNE